MMTPFDSRLLRTASALLMLSSTPQAVAWMAMEQNEYFEARRIEEYRASIKVSRQDLGELRQKALAATAELSSSPALSTDESAEAQRDESSRELRSVRPQAGSADADRQAAPEPLEESERPRDRPEQVRPEQVDEQIPAQVVGGPIAIPGGPYTGDVASRIDAGWTFNFDGGASSPSAGASITSWVWDFGTDTFDGLAVNTFKWITSSTANDDALIATGAGWGNSYAFAREPIARLNGASFQARVRSSGTSMWGFKNTGTNYSYTQMPYAIYFANGTLQVYENGSNRGTVGTYTQGEPYDVRIDLKPTTGAKYYLKTPATTTWTLLYDSNFANNATVLRGVTTDIGWFAMDDVREVFAGSSLSHKVYTEGTVTLTVTDSAGLSASAASAIQITGPALQAHAGGPYLARASERVGNGWPFNFDASQSSATTAIIDAVWDFGVDSMEGPWTATGKWLHARAAEIGAAELRGGVGWGGTYLFTSEALPRRSGNQFQTRVRSNGRAMWGLKNTSTNYSYTQMPYAIYFVDGSIAIYEDGSNRGSVGTYTQGAWYDARIVLNEARGARYMIRAEGSTSWTLLYSSGYGTTTSFLGGVTVDTGSFVLDDVREVFRGTTLSHKVYTGGPATLSVYDANSASSGIEFDVLEDPESVQASAGGPYVLPEVTATPTGLPLAMTAATSVSAPAIVSYDWDLGTEHFEGPRLDERLWNSGRVSQNGQVDLIANSNWGATYLFENQPVVRDHGPSVETRLRTNGEAMIGFKNTTTNYSYTQMPYALYFASGGLYVYEDGSSRGTVGTFTPGAWYDVRVTLLPGRGATYWVKPAGASDWQLLYASSHSTSTSFLRGVTTYSGTTSIDDWRRALAGVMPTGKVVGPGSFDLTVQNAAGEVADAVSVVSIGGLPPIARAGTDIQLAESGEIGGAWDLSVDGSMSTDDGTITSYLWNFGPDRFDDITLDTSVWVAARTNQLGRLVTTGTGSWGSGYAFDRRTIKRDPGSFLQARVVSSGNHAMWGLKDTTSSYSYTNLRYAIYFAEDRNIYIYEDGNNRGAWRTFVPNTEYDVRIELKPLGGARYLIRATGNAAWTSLYESSYSLTTELLGGSVLYSGSFAMDDFDRSVSGAAVTFRVRDDGPVDLMVTDSAHQQSSDTLNVIITGAAPIADAGGPYRVPATAAVSLDGSGSTDDYKVVGYEWDFGDGTTGVGRNSTHVYSEPGLYTVTLTVSDVAGRRDIDTTTVEVASMVVCVPWRIDPASGAEIPHDTWDGKSVRLKGVFYGPQPAAALTYIWDFGDGSTPASGVVTNKRAIEASHAYSASSGALFTATLTVFDSAGNTYRDTYRVIQRERSLDVEVNVAVDEGLWYLHKQQEADGRWRSYSSSDYFSSATASAIHAFEIHGHRPGGSIGDDPYIETVERGLDYLFTLLRPASIGVQPFGDPDTNGNGIGIEVADSLPPYQGGMVMDAIAASGAPDRVAGTGSNGVAKRTYREIVQDMGDMYSWGQYDTGSARGGWRYSWNTHPDNSACQWGAIGFLGARNAFGLDAPTWVKQQNEVWLAYSRGADGRFGYDGTGFCCGWHATTPSGMVQLAWLGIPTSDARWSLAERYIANNWIAWRNTNSTYAWYALAKAMRLAVPSPITNFTQTGLDWYGDNVNGLARYIVNRQESGGSWSSGAFPDIGRVMHTAWTAVILNPTLFTLAPVADAGDDVVWGFDYELEFDATGSFHLDPARRIVQFEWDFDGNGTYDFVGTSPIAQHTYVFDANVQYPVMFEARLRVTDDASPPQTDLDTRLVTITEPPHRPIAVAGGPYFTTFEIGFTPDGSGSFDIDPTDYITRYEWDFDGSNGYNFDNPDAVCVPDMPNGPCPVTWTYSEPGDYNIGLRVWDNGVLNIDGNFAPLASFPDFATVRVQINQPPVADPNGPYDVDECEVVTLDGSNSFDPNDDPLTFAWDFDGDGVADSTAPAPSFSRDHQGTYEVALQVSDSLLASGWVSTTLRVRDTAPSVTVSGEIMPLVGELEIYSADIVSPCDEVVSVEWDWDYTGSFVPSGDSGLAPSHAYNIQGPYTVGAWVTDEDGSTALGLLPIFVGRNPTLLRTAEHLIRIRYSRRAYDADQQRHSADAFLENIGVTPVSGPLVLAFSEFDPPSATVHQPSGDLPNGLPYVDFTSLLVDGQLAPGQVIGPKRVFWNNPGGEHLNFVSAPYILNSAPVITSSPQLHTPEGELYVYPVTAEDADGDSIAFGLEEGPAGMSIHAVTGLLTWRPPQDAAGEYLITLAAADGYEEGVARQSFTLAVTAVNVPPVILSQPRTIAKVGEQYAYALEVIDSDGDPLTLSLDTGPNGMTLDETTRIVRWDPPATGRFDVSISVADDHQHIVSQEFVLDVIACEFPPAIVSQPSLSAIEGEPYAYQVIATLPGLEETTFTAELTGEGEVPPVDTEASGSCVGTLNAAQDRLTLTCEHNVADVHAAHVHVGSAGEDGPVLLHLGSGISPLQTTWGDEPEDPTLPLGHLIDGRLYVNIHSDVYPDGEIRGQLLPNGGTAGGLIYDLEAAPPGMSIDTSGLVSWTPYFTAAGLRTVKIVVSTDDLDCKDAQIFQIDVDDINAAPEFSTSPIVVATEGIPYVYEAAAFDPDNDPITYGLAKAPTGMSINAQIGRIQWTPSQTTARDEPDGTDVWVEACDAFGECTQQRYVIAVNAINIAPKIVSAPVYGAREGDEYLYQVVAVDEDGDTVDFTLDMTPDDPTIMTIDSDGLIRWTPSQTAANRNSHPVRISVSDGQLESAQLFSIFVARVNLAPVVTAIPPQSIEEGKAFSLRVEAVDPDGDTVSYVRTSSLPSSLGIHPTSGLIEWNTGCNEAGAYLVVIEVRDGSANGTSIVEFPLTVIDVNCSPVITSTPGLVAVVGHEFVYDLTAFDPEGHPITCALGAGPAAMVIDPSCHLTWTPDAVGNYLVQIAVSDDMTRDCFTPGTWCQEFSIRVTPCLSPPLIDSAPLLTAAATNLYAYQVEAITGEPAPAVFELVDGPVGMTISEEGLVEWLPSVSDPGPHTVTVGVYTGLSECREEQAYSLEVIACTDPPAFTSTPILTADEATEYQYDVNANPGQTTDQLTYQLVAPPAGMVIDSFTGDIRWTPSRLDIGRHTVRIWATADRSDCRAEQAFRLTVARVEVFPTFTSTCPSRAYVGETYSCDLEAVDANGDAIRFVFSPDYPAPNGMTLEPETGDLRWDPSAADIGTHRIGLRVEEVSGPGFADETIDLEVLVNSAPMIRSTPPIVAVADAPYRYDADADDPDGDALIFSLPEQPPGMVIDAETGVVLWTPGLSDVGQSVPVALRADDDHGGVDTQAYEIDVLAAGTPVAPMITSVPPETAAPGCLYSYDVKAVDANGDALVCSVVPPAPSGLTIDPSSCVLQWTPDWDQVGNHEIRIRATENTMADPQFAQQIYTLTVVENAEPMITSTPVAAVWVGQTYVYDVEATDADGESLQYSLSAAPSNMMINANTGLITWKPQAEDAGPAGSNEFEIIVAAEDSRCGSSTQTYTLYVDLDTEPPVVSLNAPLAINPPDQAFPIAVQATDNVGVTSISLTVNGEPVAVGSNGVGYFSSPGPGLYDIVAIAADAAGNAAQATAQTLAIGQTETVPPQLAITEPPDGSTVASMVDIVGTVQHENLAYWTLSYAPAGAAATEFIELARGTSEVIDGVLGQLDPTLLLNGLHNIRLTSLDHSGSLYNQTVTYSIEGNMKVGNFTISYTDLEIPMAGLPITVKRTYDSRNNEKGDFGVGWTLEVASVKVEEGTPLHEGWSSQFILMGFLPAYIMVPTKAHMVDVQWPDGQTDKFRLDFPAVVNVFQYLVGVPVKLVPITGTSKMITNLDGDGFFISGDQLVASVFSSNIGEAYDPDVFTLQRHDGTVFSFAGQGRIARFQSMEDRNGNSLVVDEGGIVHSAGKSVEFTRDAQDRVTAITDPAGNVLRYEYDSRGNLIAAVDAMGQRTRFYYNRDHGLTDIVDPLGRRGVRNEYDDDGRLIAHIDAEGNRIDYERDIDGRQEVVFNRLGDPTVHNYDDRGNVILKTDPNGIQTEYEYDSRDNRIRETILSSPTCDGTEKLFSYDADDNVLTETNCSGGVISYTRDAQGNVLTRTDPLGNVTKYEYDAQGNLLKEIAADGGVTTHTYDSQGRRLSTTNPLDFTETFEYDAVGNLVAHVDFAGALREYEYDDNNNRITDTRYRTLPDGSTEAVVTQFVYDANNRQVEVVDAHGNSTITVYDAAGQRTAFTDQLGRTTKYEYAVSGALIAVVFPDGSTEEYTYDAEERRTATVNRNRQITRFQYDKLGTLTATIFPSATPGDPANNPFIEREFDCRGRITTQFDERRNETQYLYPDCNTQIVRDALGHETRHDFDMNGNRIRTVDTLLHETSYEYDVMNRLVRTIYHDGTQSTIHYDVAGRKEADFDQAGKFTRYEHDPLDRLTKVILRDEGADLATVYSYDELGNQATQSDAEGRTTRFEYDALGRRTRRILPMGQEEVSEYDAVGNLLAKTDFNGQTINNQFDVNNRLIKETLPDNSQVTYEYTPGGQRISAGGVVSQFDERDRLIKTTNPDGSFIEYGYDTAGNRTTLRTRTALLDETTTYTFDELNRLEEVNDPRGGVTTYTYDHVGNRSSVINANGTIAEYEYDDLNRLTLLTNSRDNGEVISAYAYTLGLDGQRTRVDETTPDGELRVVEYEYDGLNRLTAETIDEPAGSPNLDQVIAYTYDDVGNRQTKVVADMNGLATITYSYDANDRLLDEALVRDDGSGSPQPPVYTTYTYDDNGSTLARSKGSSTDEYTYDAKVRLVAAHIESEGLSDVTFSYDTDGIRTRKSIVGGNSTSFLVDKNLRFAQVVAEAIDSPTDPVEVVTYTHADGLLSMFRSAGGLSYYHHDGQLSTRLLTNSLGIVTDQYSFDAFGVSLASAITTQNVYRFAGEQFDPTIGLTYLRARYYSAESARFVSQDTLDILSHEPHQLHKYLYAAANPILNHDPSGHMFIAYLFTLGRLLASLCSLLTIADTIFMFLFAILVVYAAIEIQQLISNLSGLPERAPRSGVSVEFWNSPTKKHAIQKASYRLHYRPQDGYILQLAIDGRGGGKLRFSYNLDNGNASVSGGANVPTPLVVKACGAIDLAKLEIYFRAQGSTTGAVGAGFGLDITVLEVYKFQIPIVTASTSNEAVNE